jgi:hypothetical protein
MRRAKPGEIPEELRERVARPTAAQLANQIADWTAAKRQEIIQCYADTSLISMPDREANIWTPLFAVAKVAIPERLSELQTTALRLVHEKAKQDSELSPAVRLLSDLKPPFKTVVTGSPVRETSVTLIGGSTKTVFHDSSLFGAGGSIHLYPTHSSSSRAPTLRKIRGAFSES